MELQGVLPPSLLCTLPFRHHRAWPGGPCWRAATETVRQ